MSYVSFMDRKIIQSAIKNMEHFYKIGGRHQDKGKDLNTHMSDNGYFLKYTLFCT